LGPAITHESYRVYDTDDPDFTEKGFLNRALSLVFAWLVGYTVAPIEAGEHACQHSAELREWVMGVEKRPVPTCREPATLVASWEDAGIEPVYLCAHHFPVVFTSPYELTEKTDPPWVDGPEERREP
jgi:hypothetical protein